MAGRRQALQRRRSGDDKAQAPHDGSHDEAAPQQSSQPQSEATPAKEGKDGAMQDGHVTVVQDASEYRGHMAVKAHDARWVRGLSPEDEIGNDPATLAEQLRREQMLARQRQELQSRLYGAAWGNYHNGSNGGNKGRVADYFVALADLLRGGRRPRHWLATANLLGIAYLTLLALRVSGHLFTHTAELDFPMEERALWWYGRRTGESIVNFCARVVRPLCLPSAVAAAYALCLSFCIGTAARQFTALCGVGVALLALFSLFVQAVLLWIACAAEKGSECDVPLVLYWLCSVVRLGGPLLAVWCIAPVVDAVRGGRVRWRVWLALPLLLFAGAVIVAMRDDEDAGDAASMPGGAATAAAASLLSSSASLFRAAEYATLAAWGALWGCCLVLPIPTPLSRPFATEPHQE